MEEARQYTEMAYVLAKQFDDSPVYQLKGIRFVQEEYEELSFFEGLGNTAMEAVENQLFHRVQLSKGEEYVKQIWEELKNGKVNL